MPLRHRTIPSNDARVPTPDEGEAIIVTRYGRPMAAIVAASDLTEMEEARDLLDATGQLVPEPMSALALRLHREDETAGTAIEDHDTLVQILGQ